jgi:hypothetical protein
MSGLFCIPVHPQFKQPSFRIFRRRGIFWQGEQVFAARRNARSACLLHRLTNLPA